MDGDSAGFHEAAEKLSQKTCDLHRALVSLQEELQAVDWYGQRIDATTDVELKGILIHNRDEEKEHASMLLEWIRRADATWDTHLREFVFQDGPIVETKKPA